MEARLEQRKPVRVAFVRHVGPYVECDTAWAKLSKFATEQGWFPSNVIVLVEVTDYLRWRKR